MSAGCEPLPGYVPEPAPGTRDVRVDEESELGAACPSPLDACGRSITPACRVSCQPAADGCASVWELHRFRLPDDHWGQWLGLDADGSHGLFTSYPIPDLECQYPRVCDDDESDDRPTEYSIWSPDAVTPFSPAHTRELGLAIEKVSDDGRTVFATFRVDPLYWTADTGVQPVPLERASMARNGRLFAGQVEGGGARWSPGSSVEVIPIDAPINGVVAEGDAALFMTPAGITYSPAAGQRTLIEFPSDVPADASFRAVLAAADASFVLEAESWTESRLYRWSDGAFEPIELPPHAPRLWSIEQLFVSDDGSAVIVDIEHGEDEERQLVRWTEQTGTQLLSGDANFTTTFVSSTGDVIHGSVELANGHRMSMRWTPEGGMEDISTTSGVVALDGDVRVTMDDDGVRVHALGRAAGVPLPLDHLRGRLVAKRPFWPTVTYATTDARVIAGVGSDDPGNAWLWVARLQTACPGAAD